MPPGDKEISENRQDQRTHGLVVPSEFWTSSGKSNAKLLGDYKQEAWSGTECFNPSVEWKQSGGEGSRDRCRGLAEGLDPEETPRGNNMLACKKLAQLGP